MGKRKCHFNDQLQKEFKSFKTCDQSYLAKCTTCDQIIDISNKGKISLTNHINSKSHLENLKIVSSNSKLTSWTIHNTEKEKVTAIELTLAYHTVYHNFSFLSTDCTNKLLSIMFNDSSVAKKISSKRTKTEALINGIIGPYALSKCVEDIETCSYVSIITDTSNHKFTKLFPLIIQYFSLKEGFSSKIVDLISLPNEQSQTLFESIKNTLIKFKIEDKCIGFGGDNCPVNFGSSNHRGNNNVFARLRFFNENIQGVGCSVHILNNAIQKSIDCLSVDLVSILSRIYEHFSIFTVRVEALKDICKEEDVEFKQMLSYSRTRWLSLLPVIQRNIDMFDALKIYFLSNDATRKVKLLKMYFENPLSKAYLYFVQSLSEMFHIGAKKLERNDTSIIETLSIVDDIIQRIRNRIDFNFVPNHVKKILNNIVDTRKTKEFSNECLLSLKEALNYLEKWSNQYRRYENFKWISLDKEPNWNEIENSIKFMINNGCDDINDSTCMNQFSYLQTFYRQFNVDLNDKSLNKKWKYFLKLIH